MAASINLSWLKAFLGTFGLALANPGGGQAHWTYGGKNGPEHWGALDAAYAACSEGSNQSPIDITAPVERDLRSVAFHYQPSELHIVNDGRTVQVNYDPGSYIEAEGVRYDVLQFHYHAPSEHAVDGKLFAAEFHIVHRSAAGKLAVVGVFLQAGAENPAFDPFIDNLPVEKTDVRDAGVQANAADMLPAVRTTYRYSGSLTTPPCSEEVSWLVMTVPVELSATQLSRLAGVCQGNNRPLQALNGRTIVKERAWPCGARSSSC